LTLPTHPLAVVPLKLWRPRWFDGVALTLGAIAPDVPFALDGYGLPIRGHAFTAPLWWAVPFVLVVTPLVRWAAAPVAAHLPAGGPLALRDYGVLGTVRHRWWVTAASAALGAASHIAWDAVTHPYIDGGRVEIPALHATAPTGDPWWHLFSFVSDSIGFGVVAALALHCGQARLVRRWHGPPPVAPRRPVLFWTVSGTVLAAGVATLPLHPVDSFPSQAVRAMLATGVALLAGAAAVRVAHNRSRGRESGTRRETAAHRR
jgi:hypothetical protein